MAYGPATARTINQGMQFNRPAPPDQTGELIRKLMEVYNRPAPSPQMMMGGQSPMMGQGGFSPPGLNIAASHTQLPQQVMNRFPGITPSSPMPTMIAPVMSPSPMMSAPVMSPSAMSPSAMNPSAMMGREMPIQRRQPQRSMMPQTMNNGRSQPLAGMSMPVPPMGMMGAQPPMMETQGRKLKQGKARGRGMMR